MSDVTNVNNEEMLAPSQPVDLTNCDREPIHIPGNIQPHGVLLVLREPDLTIVQASENTASRLGIADGTVIGKSITELFEEEPVRYLKNLLADNTQEGNPKYAFRVDCAVDSGATAYEWILHRAKGGVPVLEGEPVTMPITTPTEAWAQTSSAAITDLIKRAIPRLRNADSLQSLYQTVAEEVRALTGFDRVMLYRFDDDGHGSVEAEAKREDLEPFLGLHYPATDIPKQARRLYVLNQLRLIADVGYTPNPVLPAQNPVTHDSLDMSYCALRSVSPIHIEYLHNMGVSASMSISIVQDNELWGLIACHHYSGPRYLSFEVRGACELLGQVVSLQLTTREEENDSGYRDRIQQVRLRLVELMASQEDFYAGMYQFNPTLRDLMECGGYVIIRRNETPGSALSYLRFDDTPTETQITHILEYLIAERRADDLFVTDRLPSLLPEADGFRSVASGILWMPLLGTKHGIDTISGVMWFRPEMVQTVSWAGNPEKSVEPAEDGSIRLSPRKSFAKWQQDVYGRSLAWKRIEVEAALELRRAVLRIILSQAEELARVNAELQRSNTELDSFAYVASHDLREPLRGIHNYAQFLQEDHADELTEDAQTKINTLLRLTRRMESLIDSLLHYSRVGRVDLAWETVDMNALVATALEETSGRLQENGVMVRIPRPLPTAVRCDPVQMGEVFTNLISNAAKYSNKPAGERWVEIGFEENTSPDTPVIYYIKDNGIGIADRHYTTIFGIFKRLHGRSEYGGGTGAGLTIVRTIIERHGGKIWLNSKEGEGTVFYFTLVPDPIT